MLIAIPENIDDCRVLLNKARDEWRRTQELASTGRMDWPANHSAVISLIEVCEYLLKNQRGETE